MRPCEASRARYDFVLIDCPPSLGLLTVNALTAAEACLIPLQCEFYALEGLAQLMETIALVRRHLNPALGVVGIVLTMVDPRTKLSEQVAADVRAALSRSGVLDRDSKERPARGGAQLRAAGAVVRAVVPGC